MTTTPNNRIDEVGEIKPDLKLVRVLQKDFKELYQPQFTTNYKDKQLIINIELGIMRLSNLEKYIQSERNKARQEFADELKNELPKGKQCTHFPVIEARGEVCKGHGCPTLMRDRLLETIKQLRIKK